MPMSPQHLYVEILTPKVDGISSWGLWEVLKSMRVDGALTKGISALIKETPQSALVPFAM